MRLSTYLFSFVAGRFEKIEGIRDGRKISMYHRETDPEKVAQSNEIIDIVFDSMEWFGDYVTMRWFDDVCTNDFDVLRISPIQSIEELE